MAKCIVMQRLSSQVSTTPRRTSAALFRLATGPNYFFEIGFLENASRMLQNNPLNIPPDFMDLYIFFLQSLVEEQPQGLKETYEFAAKYFERKIEERDSGKKFRKRENIFEREVLTSGRVTPFLPDFSYDSVLEFYPDDSASNPPNEENIKQLLKKEKDIIVHLRESLAGEDWKKAFSNDPKAFQETNETNQGNPSNGFLKIEVTPSNESKLKSEDQLSPRDILPQKVHNNLSEDHNSLYNKVNANREIKIILFDDSKENKKVPSEDWTEQFEKFRESLQSSLVALGDRKQNKDQNINPNGQETSLDLDRNKDIASNEQMPDQATLLREKRSYSSQINEKIEHGLMKSTSKIKDQDDKQEGEIFKLKNSENDEKENNCGFIKQHVNFQKKKDENPLKHQNSPEIPKIINLNNPHDCQETLFETLLQNGDFNQKRENRHGNAEKKDNSKNQCRNEATSQQNPDVGEINISINAKLNNDNQTLTQIVEFSRLLPKYIDVLSKMFLSQDEKALTLQEPIHQLPKEVQEDSEEIHSNKNNVHFKNIRTHTRQTDQGKLSDSFDLNGFSMSQPMLQYIRDVTKAAKNLLQSLDKNAFTTYLDPSTIDGATFDSQHEDKLAFESLQSILDTLEKTTEFADETKCGKKACDEKSTDERFISASDDELLAPSYYEDDTNILKSKSTNGRNSGKWPVKKHLKGPPFTENINEGEIFFLNNDQDSTEDRSLKPTEDLIDPTNSSINKCSAEDCTSITFSKSLAAKQKLQENGKRGNGSILKSKPPLEKDSTEKDIEVKFGKKKPLKSSSSESEEETMISNSDEKSPFKDSLGKPGFMQHQTSTSSSENSSEENQDTDSSDTNEKHDQSHKEPTLPTAPQTKNKIFINKQKTFKSTGNLDWRDFEQTRDTSSNKQPKEKSVAEKKPKDKGNKKNSPLDGNNKEADDTENVIHSMMDPSIERDPPCDSDTIPRVENSPKESEQRNFTKKYRDFQCSTDTNHDLMKGNDEKTIVPSIPKQIFDIDKDIDAMETNPMKARMEKCSTTPDLDETERQFAGTTDPSNSLQRTKKHGQKKRHEKKSPSRNSQGQLTERSIFLLLSPRRSSNEGRFANTLDFEIHQAAIGTENAKIVIHDEHRATTVLKKRIENSRRLYRKEIVRDFTAPGSIFDGSWSDQSVSVTGRSWLRTYLTSRMIRRYQKDPEWEKFKSEDGLEDLATPVLKHRGSEYGLRSYFSQRSLFGSIRIWYFARKLRAYQEMMNSENGE
ncbi:uncharacterized protein TNCT_337801 [Trichonephila clavata]|uniref:Uncharacterized protein n=1 Tax=Trichonephila clavata TaxID=2740835 RepID=A0A8X6GLY6_TRICU|nr:uncharacterized protein TNCT_337801 [Trichonephila clavata]